MTRLTTPLTELVGIEHPAMADTMVPIVFSRDLSPHSVLFSDVGPSDRFPSGFHPDAPFTRMHRAES